MGFPAANRTAQWYYDNVGGSPMGSVEKCVWHTTETQGWPSYDGGRKAPHYTVRPDFATRTMLWRQHFPETVNARALRNLPGGVETNLDGALQVEVVGTCDETRDWPDDMLKSWDLETWQVEGLAEFVAYAYTEHGLPLHAPTTWLAYGPDPRAPGRNPASYGASPVRFPDGTWDRYRGHCGHQHVPEQVHGDPGRFPMARILARATMLLEPGRPDEGDDDMQAGDQVRLGPSAARVLNQADAVMTYEEILAVQAAQAVEHSRLLVELIGKVDALTAALTPPAAP